MQYQDLMDHLKKMDRATLLKTLAEIGLKCKPENGEKDLTFNDWHSNESMGRFTAKLSGTDISYNTIRSMAGIDIDFAPFHYPTRRPLALYSVKEKDATSEDWQEEVYLNIAEPLGIKVFLMRYFPYADGRLNPAAELIIRKDKTAHLPTLDIEMIRLCEIRRIDGKREYGPIFQYCPAYWFIKKEDEIRREAMCNLKIA